MSNTVGHQQRNLRLLLCEGLEQLPLKHTNETKSEVNVLKIAFIKLESVRIDTYQWRLAKVRHPFAVPGIDLASCMVS